MISFNQVHKRYPGGYEALKGVTFDIDEGEMVFVTGHSGAGKSTLLKLDRRHRASQFRQRAAGERCGEAISANALNAIQPAANNSITETIAAASGSALP